VSCYLHVANHLTYHAGKPSRRSHAVGMMLPHQLIYTLPRHLSQPPPPSAAVTNDTWICKRIPPPAPAVTKIRATPAARTRPPAKTRLAAPTAAAAAMTTAATMTRLIAVPPGLALPLARLWAPRRPPLLTTPP